MLRASAKQHLIIALLANILALPSGRAEVARRSCGVVSRLENLLRETRRPSASAGKSARAQRAELLTGELAEVPNKLLPGTSTVPELLTKLKSLDAIPPGLIAKDYIQFYNRQTGRFEYRPSRPQILAAENGSQKLSAVRLNYDRDAFGFTGASSPLVIQDYSRAMREMPGMQLWIAHAENSADEVQKLTSRFPKDVRSRVKTISHKVDQSDIWAQDGSKPLVDGNATLIHKDSGSLKMPRPQYRWVTEAVGNAGIIETRRSPFSFAGGNIIVGDRHVFVGSSIVRNAMQKFNIDRANALDVLSAEFGKPIFKVGVPNRVGIGGLSEIVFHIDLDMAVLRNRRATGISETVVVQSPEKLLTDVFGFPNLDDLNPAKFETAKQTALKKWRKMTDDGSPISVTERSLLNGLADLKYADVLEQDTQLRYLERKLQND